MMTEWQIMKMMYPNIVDKEAFFTVIGTLTFSSSNNDQNERLHARNTKDADHTLVQNDMVMKNIHIILFFALWVILSSCFTSYVIYQTSDGNTSRECPNKVLKKFWVDLIIDVLMGIWRSGNFIVIMEHQC